MYVKVIQTVHRTFRLTTRLYISPPDCVPVCGSSRGFTNIASSSTSFCRKIRRITWKKGGAEAKGEGVNGNYWQLPGSWTSTSELKLKLTSKGCLIAAAVVVHVATN